MHNVTLQGEGSPRINRLIRLLLLSVFFLYFLHHNLGVIPRFLTWIPELLAMAALFLFVLHAAINRQYFIAPKYFGLIVLYLLVIFTGMILHGTSMVSAVAGLRFYLKHLPFFLLPAVWAFSDKALVKQLSFLLPVLLFQFPIAVFQRLYHLKKWHTGDVVTGTLATSSELSIVMICTMAIVFAFYLKGRLSLKRFCLMAICLFIPTTINETKATLILLPLAFLIPIFLFKYSSVHSSKKRNLMAMAMISVLFLTAFIPIYNAFYGGEQGGITGFFLDRKQLKQYLYRERTEADLEAGRYLPRGDALVLGFKKLAEDPVDFAFGLGAGNLIRSYLREASEETHLAKLYGVQHLAATNLLWELGLAGVIIYYSFLFTLLRDALALRRHPGATGAFALGWSAVVVIMCLCVFYKNILYLHVTNFVFWYFSGLVASATFRYRTALNLHGVGSSARSGPGLKSY